MPTSLTYIVLSSQRLFTLETCCGYGYGPARDSHLSPGFSRASESAPDAAGDRGALRARAPISGRTDSRESLPFTKKRELFPGPPPTSPGSFALPHWTPRRRHLRRPGSGILTRFPFDRPGATEAIAPRFGTAFAYPLGPTDPCSTAVHMEPFSTSAFKVLV